MSNSEYLEKMKLQYPSLQGFSIVNNYLVLNTKDAQYSMPLNSVYLCNFDSIQNMFQLDSRIIFQIIYMFELISKNDITEPETNFIMKYTDTYHELNKRLTSDQDSIDENLVISLGYPVHLCYKSEYENNPTSQIVMNEMMEKELSGGKSLILVPKGYKIEEKSPESEAINNIDYVSQIMQRGFATLCLIAGAVLATCAYLLYFFSK